MKNCLIVLVFLVGCFCIALLLTFYLNGPRSINSWKTFVGTWQDYDDSSLEGLHVTIAPNQITVDYRNGAQFKRVTEKGRWTWHCFYVDSHLDAPPEVVVARELKNEDLEVNLSHFLPGQPDKVTLVMILRGGAQFDPYPVYKNGLVVSYPPPKGLIRPGMLEWDLQNLPWHSDRIEMQEDSSSEVYTYHSDRPDATQLLVTVVKGRVVQVTGGAEDTADEPYRFPDAPAEDTPAEDHKDRSWGEWLFDLIFKK
jgi:hypothetical protein